MNQPTSEQSKSQSEQIDTDVENSVLGSVLCDGNQLDEVSQIVTKNDFHSQRNQIVFETMLTLQAEGEPIDDGSLLANRLKTDGNLEIVGVDHILLLAETVAHAQNAVYYARNLRVKAQRRRLTHVCMRSLELTRDESTDIEVAISKTENDLHELLEGQAGSGPAPIGDAIIEMFEVIDSGTDTGIKTGYPDLDRYLNGGLQGGGVYIVAARPSMGKTAFAVNLLTNVAKGGHPGVIFSLEQSRRELAERQVSAMSGIPAEKIKSGTLSQVERDGLTEHSNALNNLPIHIDDSSVKTVAQIGAAARLHKRRKGLSLLVIDYLQLLQSADGRQPREVQVSTMSRSLKCLARDLDIPIICLAQLNRQLEARADKRPMLADLRESGSIEQDADCVLFLHREAVYDDAADPTDARLIVAKNRNGRRGEVHLHWNGPCMSFNSAARNYDVELF